MKPRYRIDWLLPEDARAIASVERRVYPRAERLGRQHIFEDLTEAEADGGNLSLGLYVGARLVGYVLAWREADRTKPRTYLGINLPHAEASGPGILFLDIAVVPSHRATLGRLANRFRENIECRDDVRDLPMDAFATAQYSQLWTDHPKFLERAGWRLLQSQPFRDEQRQREMFWLTFERVAKAAIAPAPRKPTVGSGLTVEVIDTESAWAALEPHWDALLRKTPDFTVFQTYAYQRTWWRYLGWKGQLCIVVARRAGQPVAIAPLQLSYTRWLGREMRCLGFIGQPSEIDRPAVLAAPDDREAVVAIADFVATRRDLWDCAVLQEQIQDSPFPTVLAERLQRAHFNVSVVNGQECMFAALTGSWSAFLGTKSRSFRKSLKRKVAQLEERGTLVFESGDPGAPDEALDRYLDVEDASWKANAGLGAGKSSAHRVFHRALIRGAVPDARPESRFLGIDEKTIAATFGLTFERRYYSLHIAHDAEWNDYSPGVVLTARELEQSFSDRTYDVFDFLGGFPTNKRTWATGAVSTFVLYADPPGLRGWLFHWIYFKAKPQLRRLMIRLRLLDTYARAKKLLTRRSRE